MPVQGAQQRIRQVVGQWRGVTEAPHRFGGVGFRLGQRELGHIHGDSLVDIPFPKRVRDEVVAAGEAEAHHILPDTGWVSVFLRADKDVDRALRLLERSLSLAVAYRARSESPAKQRAT
jgi:Luciferase